MKRVLITGVSGFLGWHVAQLANDPTSVKYKFYGIYLNHSIKILNITSSKINVRNIQKIKSFCETNKITTVLHLAALSNANYCELHPDESQQTNYMVSIELAKLCKEMKMDFLFASTDLVFGGSKGNYTEQDVPDPICLYGKHKSMAEQDILNENKNAIVARLPLMYGLSGYAQSFFSNWIQQLKIGNEIKAFTNEWRTPAYAKDVVKGIFLLLENDQAGIWHLGGKERISRYDFAVKMAERFELNPDLIIPLLQKDVPMPAARPADVSLNSEKAYYLGYDPMVIDKALEELRSLENLEPKT